MTRLYIAQPFTLMRDDGKRQSFESGAQAVEDEIAAHWYVQAHCQDQPADTLSTEALAQAPEAPRAKPPSTPKPARDKAKS